MPLGNVKGALGSVVLTTMQVSLTIARYSSPYLYNMEQITDITLEYIACLGSD